MSLADDEHWAFATRPIYEEQWSAREDLLKAHGYNLRPRLRQDWTPSWLTTGKSPLQSEDGEMLRVHQLLDRSIFYANDVIVPPR